MATVRTVHVRVNGIDQAHAVEARHLLVHFLRDACGLTGTHVGCETSLCGACTVLLDGKAVKSCTVFAVQADGRTVTTVEGLAHGDELHPVQQGFWECHGLQCGFCTPGMMMTAVQIARRTSPADARADRARPERQSVPVHGLQPHHRRRAPCRRSTRRSRGGRSK